MTWFLFQSFDITIAHRYPQQSINIISDWQLLGLSAAYSISIYPYIFEINFFSLYLRWQGKKQNKTELVHLDTVLLYINKYFSTGAPFNPLGNRQYIGTVRQQPEKKLFNKITIKKKKKKKKRTWNICSDHVRWLQHDGKGILRMMAWHVYEYFAFSFI